MTAFTSTLTETLTINDRVLLTRPYAYVTDSVRTMSSILLRLRRKPIRYVSFDLPPHYAYLKPGTTIWATHDQLPGAATGTDRYDVWRMIPLHVVEVSDPLTPPRISVKCVDLREVYCSWWSPLVTDIGMTDDLNGIAIIDRAGGWETVRAQVGYGVRPPGNDSYQEVLPDNPIIDAFGLMAEGGDDVNRLKNSTFSEGAGDVFTNWTKTLTGGALGVGWTLYTLIDATGFRRAIQLVTEAAGESAYVTQTVNAVENKRMAVRVYYKDGGSFDRMRLKVTRSDTSEFLDASDGSWSAAPVDNELTPASGVIDTLRFVTPVFETTSGGSVNLSVGVGHYSAASTARQISQIQGIELLQASSTAAADDNAWSFRSPLPTKAAAVTRVRNLTGIINDSAVAVVSPVRGYVKMTVRPYWSHFDLFDSHIKYAWAAEFGGGGSLRIGYYRLNFGSGYWQFVNEDGRTCQLLVDAAFPLRDQTYQIIARWTSTTHNEHGLDGQALDLWVDGVQAPTEETCNQQASLAENNVYLGCVPGLDQKFSWDGHITNVTMDIRCPTYEEMARI